MRAPVLLLLKAVALASPLALTAAVYVACDPFRVLRHYEFGDYYDDAAPVELNRDYVSLQLFWKYEPVKHFDSFILGSSRSFPFQCDAWQRYIAPATPFHYPAASENIYGILKKLLYLEQNHIPLRHVLIEAGMPALAGATARYDAPHRLPYELTGESWVDFEGGFLKAFFSDLYFLKYMDYRARGRVDSFSSDALAIRRGAIRIRPETNDMLWPATDRELQRDEGAYYANHPDDFPPRSDAAPPCADPVIHAAQISVLGQIRGILARNGTDYRVVLTPEYRQICLNPRDLGQLMAIFGQDHVVDLLGVNEYTRDRSSFYDGTHVRLPVAEKILADIYTHGDAKSASQP
jgi:hypothetical protein